MPYEARHDGFLISADKRLLDIAAVHEYLGRSYWAEGIPLEVVRRSIEGSMCFGVYEVEGGRAGRGTQVGFARVISDKATFAYLCDVFILEPWRGRGLSKWLVEVILAHPELQGLRRFCLLTKDAQGLYARYGFEPLEDPRRFMGRVDRDVYKRAAGGNQVMG